MKTAIATRFRCRSPLTDLLQKTLMFLTLIFQYLNKLIEGKVRDFPSPEAFHAVKVQGFNGDSIKLLAQFRGELPMKVFALVCDFPIQTCDLSHTPPPTVRTFNFTRKTFVEGSQFLQRLFQRLWVLFLLTRAECQVCVFHAEVCPNAFTCCRQTFHIRVGCDYAEPIVSAVVSLECDTTERAVPLTVFMESIRDFIKLPFACFRIPLAKGQRDTIIFQRPPRVSRKGDRLELVTLLDSRSATEFLEKTLVCPMDTFQLLLDRLTWQGLPMRVSRIFQNFYVVTHTLKAHIRQTVFIPLTLPLMEILMHLPHIIQQVANADRIRLFPKRVVIRFHRLSQYHRVNPFPVGWQTHNQAIVLEMSATVIYLLKHILRILSSVFSITNLYAVYIPKLKHGALTEDW